MLFLRLHFTILLFSLSSLVFAVYAAEDEVELPLTKQSATELIQQESKGKILSVDKKSAGENVIFLIKVLHKDGKIKIYSLDAATGSPPK